MKRLEDGYVIRVIGRITAEEIAKLSQGIHPATRCPEKNEYAIAYGGVPPALQDAQIVTKAAAHGQRLSRYNQEFYAGC